MDHEEPGQSIWIYDITPHGEDIFYRKQYGAHGYILEHFLVYVSRSDVGVSVYEFDEDGQMYDEHYDSYEISLIDLDQKFLNEIFKRRKFVCKLMPK